ncbi:hypothetical protein ES703_08557 [subsurface metagenome]
MHSTPDYSILDKFNFEHKPVGVKFLLNKPKGIRKLDKGLAFCEMLGEAQKTPPFYADRENFTCMGPVVLGMEQPDPIFESGQVGAKDGIYKEARANRRIYHYIPKLAKGTVRYVAFSPLDKLPFEPDVLIITAQVSQAEVLLRAYCYTSGKMITTKSTPVLICAWLYAYPFVSGEMNYSVTGLGFGMKARKVLPEGLILLSFPYDSLPMLIENLKDMEWVPLLHRLSEEEKKEQFQRTVDELRKEYES